MKPNPKWPYPLRPALGDWDHRNLFVPDDGSENSEHRAAYLWSTAGILPIGMHPRRAREIADRVAQAECPLLEEFMAGKASPSHQDLEAF